MDFGPSCELGGYRSAEPLVILDLIKLRTLQEDDAMPLAKMSAYGFRCTRTAATAFLCLPPLSHFLLHLVQATRRISPSELLHALPRDS